MHPHSPDTLCPLLLGVDHIYIPCRNSPTKYGGLLSQWQSGRHRYTIRVWYGRSDNRVCSPCPKRLTQELKTEYDRVILILTDHSDKDTGDLFIGPDESGIVTSAPVDNVSDWTYVFFLLWCWCYIQFFHELLTPFQEVVHGSMMYITACSSIVNNEESFNRMHSTIAE